MPFVLGFWDSRGWGFGLFIITKRGDVAAVPGWFSWDGGLGTPGYSDPKEEMIRILMTQRLMDPILPVSFSIYGHRPTRRSTTRKVRSICRVHGASFDLKIECGALPRIGRAQALLRT